jgi:hypothetical protein
MLPRKRVRLVERHRAVVALKQGADLFVAGTWRRFLRHRLTVRGERNDDAVRALPSPHSSAGNQQTAIIMSSTAHSRGAGFRAKIVRQ